MPLGCCVAARVHALSSAGSSEWTAVPATVAIRGGLSDVVSVATFARMRAAKSDLQQLEIANRGHAPTLDEPTAVAAIDAATTGSYVEIDFT